MAPRASAPLKQPTYQVEKDCMGYFVTRNGSSWRLRHTRDRGKKKGKEWRSVDRDSAEAQALGLSSRLTFEEADGRVKAHRAERRLKEEAERRGRVEARKRKDGLVESAWLPADVVLEFEKHVVPSENIPDRHWRAVKHLVADVNLDPSEWRFRKRSVWEWFRRKAYSPDYTWRLLRVANLYLTLLCARRGKVWADVPPPDGPELVKLVQANRLARKGRQYTFPLTLETLKRSKQLLSPERYRWQATSLWFGLRSEEMEKLVPEEEGTSWRVDRSDPRFEVLWVLQWKLVREGIPEEEAWKAVPVVEPEQKELLPFVERGELERPSAYALKKVHPRLSYRSGRAAFVAVMHADRGYPETVCSKWLGHRSLQTTRLSYERPSVVYWEPSAGRRKAAG